MYQDIDHVYAIVRTSRTHMVRTDDLVPAGTMLVTPVLMYVRDETQNVVTYWRCEDYLKCKNHAYKTEDNRTRAPSGCSHFTISYLWAIA